MQKQYALRIIIKILKNAQKVVQSIAKLAIFKPQNFAKKSGGNFFWTWFQGVDIFNG